MVLKMVVKLISIFIANIGTFLQINKNNQTSSLLMHSLEEDANCSSSLPKKGDQHVFQFFMIFLKVWIGIRRKNNKNLCCLSGSGKTIRIHRVLILCTDSNRSEVETLYKLYFVVEIYK